MPSAEEDVKYLLLLLKHDFDFHAVAVEAGITAKAPANKAYDFDIPALFFMPVLPFYPTRLRLTISLHSQIRYKAIVNRHGYDLENGKRVVDRPTAATTSTDNTDNTANDNSFPAGTSSATPKKLKRGRTSKKSDTDDSPLAKKSKKGGKEPDNDDDDEGAGSLGNGAAAGTEATLAA